MHCKNLTKGLYTLGGCGHMFCRNCCDEFLGKDCPVCSIPTHVRDATVNRPMSNVVGLCQELERILLCQSQSKKIPTQNTVIESDKTDRETLQDILECTPSSKSLFTDNEPSSFTKINGKKNTPQPSPGTQQSSRKTKNSKNTDSSFDQLFSKSDTTSGTAEDQKKKRPVSNNTKLTKRGRYDDPVLQTTMTQFFDCDDDDDVIMEDEDISNTINNSILVTDKTTSCSAVKKKNLRRSRKSDNPSISSLQTPDHKMTTSSSSAISAKSSKERMSGRSKSSKTPQLQEKESLKLCTPGETPKRIPKVTPKRVPKETPKRIPKVTPKQTPKSASSGTPISQSSRTPRSRSSANSATKTQMKRNARGETPLHVAAIKGDYKKVEELLKNGTNVNVRENAGWTPLHEAVNHGHVDIAKLLINHGAMINIPGHDNDTPLHDAINNNRLDCVRLLVSKGASLSLRNIHGLTPKDIAVTDQLKTALETPLDSQVIHNSAEQMDENDEFSLLCFLGTALSRDEKIQIQKCASVLQARVVEEFCPEVTHVITSCNKDGLCPRTIKYLHAILAGTWVVNMAWVSTCIEYGSRVSEEAFEIPGTSTNADSRAAYKGRLNRKQQLPGLFDGCQFYFHGIFEYPTPEKEQLMELVKAGGGKVLSREPKLQNLDEYPATVPYHAARNTRFTDCAIFIVHDTNLAYPPINATRMCAVPASWILESIGSFAFQNID
ncbi:BRCA1-associated RING domain protein 1 isoform X2 [Patella vulgata]|uniref:BRCA1-associated RING domain protein 1 isoform X2 n=1 Tax=Patella vulgata TaxID=6465 RepID=UPI00217F2CA3|nr:BRCA1-associated RING domain protein 1 isoform X2 [Patella vulgata]